MTGMTGMTGMAGAGADRYLLKIQNRGTALEFPSIFQSQEILFLRSVHDILRVAHNYSGALDNQQNAVTCVLISMSRRFSK